VNGGAAALVLPIMKQQLLRGVVCCGVLAVCSAACDVKVGDQGMSFDVTHGRANDEWTRTYTIEKGGRLEIASAGGPVYVTAGGPGVQVKLLRQGQAGSDEAAQQLLKEETISEDVAPDRVRVETRRPGTNTGAFGRRRVSTEWHVSIPAGLNVAIKGENADISLKSVEGNFTLENTNGGFRASGISGAVTATTVNGVVELEFVSVTGDVKATTINGPVRVSLPENADVTLEASTVNGGVIVDDALKFTPTIRERVKVTGRVNDGGPKLILQTTNGPVRVGVTGSRPGRRGGPNRVEPEVLEREIQAR
jgi:hypothetical protein